MSENEKSSKRSNFIRHIIDNDLEEGKHETIVTRFPPEPNGYLHIGHAKAICLNFGLGKDYQGRTHLRFDDTNPEKEEIEYVESIKKDIQWLGWDWGENLFYASDYFEKLYDYGVELIKLNKAFICSLNAEQMNEYRGSLTEPGKPSPDRDRPIEESLDIFARMRKGEFPDGKYTLRAKIDMASPNVHLRDPVIYRIRHVEHWRTGNKWCIYPMYDYTHCISDALEGITHSLCSLEFEVHRPLYDWVLDNITIDCHPRQIEFARLNLNFTVMSKRKLLQLVKEGHVNGWDDPRMPTLAGLRRRGYTPSSIRNFCEEIGMAKADSVVDIGMLESCIRNDLNTTTKRVMAVLDPLKVTITNYPEGQVEELEAPYFPDDPPKFGDRKVPFGKTLYIERDDFQEKPMKKFFRLAPGKEVRLRWAYFLTCNEVVKDDEGNIIELLCTYDPETKGGNAPDGRKVKGTIHWVSAEHSLPAEVRLYDRLFDDPAPDSGKKDFLQFINKDSLHLLKSCRVERSLADVEPGTRFQFERKGYFIADAIDCKADGLVFNRIVTLKDSWTRMMKQKAKEQQQKLQQQKQQQKQAKKKEKKKKGPPETPAEITFDDFWKVKLVVAKVLSCEKVEGADKLLKVELDAGEEGKPTVCAGLAPYYKAEELVGRTVIWVGNLAPRKMRGVMSQGMIMATDTPDGAAKLVEPSPEAKIGSRIH